MSQEMSLGTSGEVTFPNQIATIVMKSINFGSINTPHILQSSKIPYYIKPNSECNPFFNRLTKLGYITILSVRKDL